MWRTGQTCLICLLPEIPLQHWKIYCSQRKCGESDNSMWNYGCIVLGISFLGVFIIDKTARVRKGYICKIVHCGIIYNSKRLEAA